MLLVCGLCNIGCDRKSNIKNDVVRLESRSIEIPTEYMMCIEGTSDSFFVKSDEAMIPLSAKILPESCEIPAEQGEL